MAQLGILVVISPFPGIKSNAYTGLQFPKRNVIANHFPCHNTVTPDNAERPIY